jgi:hypothetical protein
MSAGSEQSAAGGQRYAVGLIRVDEGPHSREHVAKLRDVLHDAEFTEPDDLGVFEVRLTAPSREAALLRVFDAIAAAGADDHVVFLEHPDIPRHWQRRHADGTPA